MHHLVSPTSLRTGFFFNWNQEWTCYYKNHYFFFFRISLILNNYFKSSLEFKKMGKRGLIVNRNRFFYINFLWDIKILIEFISIFKWKKIKHRKSFLNLLQKNFSFKFLKKKNEYNILTKKYFFFKNLQKFFFLKKKIKNKIKKKFLNKIFCKLIVNKKFIFIFINILNILKKKLYLKNNNIIYIKKHNQKNKKISLKKKYTNNNYQKKNIKKISLIIFIVKAYKINFLFSCLNKKIKNLFYRINLIFIKINFLKNFLKLLFLNFFIIYDIKKLFSKLLNKKIKNFSNIFYLRKLKRSLLSAFFISEYIKLKFIQKYSLNYIFRNLKKLLVVWKRLKGYRIEINGRPFRMTRSRKFLLVNGKLKSNTFTNNIDYYLSVVRTKYGMCGIKVWLNKC